MISRLRALNHRIGYRGSVLLFLALWCGGNASRLAWPPPEARGTSTLVYLSTIAPLPVLAVPWALVAILCLVQAFMRADWLAFTALAGLLMIWAVVYLVGGARGVIPQATWAVIIQIVVAGLVVKISRWPEPHREP
ncbi:hypothetical protein OIE66_40470 [Nonomuraea sp. NBC_01738]|uniref:hypothetical protein n=1 Tax=Nonomuraea sp. NBC_01738 TaxID=2976003 RepID=UPI002E0FA9D2|nr:hypothetical protein OIE66_40470 [Nonomuraea sp. NBC_01738]